MTMFKTNTEKRTNDLCDRLIDQCEALEGLVERSRHVRAKSIITANTFKKCMSLFFPPIVFALHDDDELYAMADEFFVMFKESVGENWGKRVLYKDGKKVKLEDGSYVKSRLFVRSTLSGILSYGYFISIKSRKKRERFFWKLSKINWGDYKTLNYATGVSGIYEARKVFKTLLEVDTL